MSTLQQIMICRREKRLHIAEIKKTAMWRLRPLMGSRFYI